MIGLLFGWLALSCVMLLISILGLIITHAEISDYGRSKDRQRNLRWSWLGFLGSPVAPVVLPALVGYGLYRSVRPIKNSLSYAFGRKKEER